MPFTLRCAECACDDDARILAAPRKVTIARSMNASRSKVMFSVRHRDGTTFGPATTTLAAIRADHVATSCDADRCAWYAGMKIFRGDVNFA